MIGWVLLALALLALLRGLYEPRRLGVTRQELDAQRKGMRRRSVRIALISDLHAEMLWIKPERIVAELERTPPDLLFFTGDLVGSDRHAECAAPFLDRLGEAARAMGIPFLAVTGNHDGPSALRLMRAAGIDVLQDEQRRLVLADGAEVLITGLADRRPGAKAAALLARPGTAGVTDAAGAPIHIVLVHNPDAVLDLPEHGADFLLGGHFHGGQIYAPFHLEFRLLRNDRLPLLGHWRGPFRLRGYRGYISRGLGCVWLPLRFLSLPELAILDLTVEAA